MCPPRVNLRHFCRYIHSKSYYALNCLPSNTLDNADSRISRDVDQMFREFFNVAAIVLTNATIFVAIMATTVAKSRFTQIAVLAQFIFAALCLPLVNYFVGPASAAVAVLKQRDGSFNFQVHLRRAFFVLPFCDVTLSSSSTRGSRNIAKASHFTPATTASAPPYPKHSTAYLPQRACASGGRSRSISPATSSSSASTITLWCGLHTAVL